MDYQLLLAAVGGIALLLFLILYLKIQAFLSLLIVSMFVGVVSGMPPEDILNHMKDGMAGTLGFVATVVGLGALFGAILEYSGGAQRLASYMLGKMGIKKAPWAVMVTGFIVAIPVFFDVAFIILVPVIFALKQRTGKSLLLFAIPLLAGLAITHSFIPPTPGPVAVADILGADLGWVIITGFITGIPAAVVAGPLFASYISRKIDLPLPDSYIEQEKENGDAPPPWLILSIITLPILLIVARTMVESPFIKQTEIPGIVSYIIILIGHPFTALIIANLVAWYWLGVSRGATKTELLKISSKSLYPAGVIILLTGAGGAFKQILVTSGVGTMLVESLSGDLFSPVLFAFIIAAIVRIMQGSATVAMITAAGITAPLLMGSSFGDIQKAVLVIAIASGATILSHVNDSGFWLVSQYLGMSEKQTFRSWTVMTTLIAVTGLIVSLLLWLVV
ncbi:Low-affinity gluconate/H+ symporter GntU [Fulvivirga imtechensis AK7]|uniref:Low-affinity gluconate/H+ symporter GntU n=1 Tax=Fulvivirga imtechensis AK7 TaxID=1237149 RepID=L8JWK6_9BACT|nr:gluconate:H+ symporter [Fulvivirga imtechensis]ELR73431.1 Low-affinity gluconate/H+ symporter GntU [Fulvivirga imtechensis AK7]